jgi:hypothetical protein
VSSHIIKSFYGGLDVGLTVNVALSLSDTMSSPTLVGVQTIDANKMATHSATGLTAATRYYGRLVQPSTGAYFGEQFSFVTAPATTGTSYTIKLALVSCQENSADVPHAWQDILDWGADAIAHTGDYGYIGQDIDATDSYMVDINKRTNAHRSNTIMRQAIQSAAYLTPLISDHELHNGGDRWQGDSPIDTPGCLHSIRELQAFDLWAPVRTRWDVRSPRQHRGHHFDIGAKIRCHVLDFRTPERSNPNDVESVDKQMLGAAQEASFFAALDSTRLNIVFLETSWWPGPTSGATDKPASYTTAQARIVAKMNGTGAYAGGPVYKAIFMGGDRHYQGYFNAAASGALNRPQIIGSGTSKDSLSLQTGEVPTWQWGAGLRTVQTVTLVGAVTTFTITFNGQTTASIAAAASAATVQAALVALSNVAPGDIVVNAILDKTTGLPIPGTWEFRWGGAWQTNTVLPTGTATGTGSVSVLVVKEDSPVCGYQRVTIAFNNGTGAVTVSSVGRAVLDTSGPVESWVISDIPSGTSSNSWTP